MAVSSTAAATCYSTACMAHGRESLMLPSSKQIIKPKNNNNNGTTSTKISYLTLGLRSRASSPSSPSPSSRRLSTVIVRSTAGSASSSTSTAAEGEGEGEAWQGEGEEGEGVSSSMEVAKGPPSLISALNVQKALRGIAITDVDHYGRLGLGMGCTFDQVRVAYQNKVNEVSNQGLDEEELNKQLELLKESYAILSSEEERRLYDWSLARTDNPERYTWPFEVDITQIPQGTPPPREPEDVGPTVAVGYFILGWLVLSFALSIALNL